MNSFDAQLSSGRSVVERALVLESHLDARSGLLDEMHRLRFAEEVLEAKSIDAGLGILRADPIDACIIGPGISSQGATRFLKESSRALRSSGCTYIALRRCWSPQAQFLTAAGADAVLAGPDSPLTLETLLEALTRKSAARTTAASTASPAQRPDSTILVVDPQLLRQKQLRAILRSLGHGQGRIETCRTLTEAERLVDTHGYEAVFVCLSPREKPALEFIQGRQHGGAVKPSRFIAYCPHASREQVLSASLSGASSFLAYPFSAAAVEAALETKI